VYLLPADKPDEGLDVKGVLDLSLRAQNAWMARETGGRTWRLDTFAFKAKVDGAARSLRALDVTFLRSKRPSDELRGLGAVADELKAADLVRPTKRYLVYAAVEGDGVCGRAAWPYASTDPEVVGQFAAVYLDAGHGCMSRDFAASVDSPGKSEAIAQQELMHNDGAVPLSAPHQCASVTHVCTAAVLGFTALDPERFDVMFPTVLVPLREKRLDLGRDDYYDAVVATRDLARSPFLTPRPK
jgi:hypothetical protein